MKIYKLTFLKSKMIKASFWYTIGNILLKGVAFLTLPIFTRILSTKDYGIFNTYVAYVSIVSLIIGLGLHGSVKAAKYDFKDRFRQYLSASIGIIVLIFIIMIIIVNSIYPHIKHTEEYTMLMVNILFIHSFGLAVIQFVNSSYIIESKYKRFMLISCFITLVDILLSLLFCTVLFNKNLYIGRILGNSIPFMIVGLILCIGVLYKGRVFFDANFFKYGLKIGLPLIPHTLSLTLLAQLDRIMIQKMIGYSEAGIYSFAYTIAAILSIVMSSLDNAWGAWFYDNLDKKNYKHIEKKNRIYVIFFTCITIGFIIIVPEIIKIMSASAYWGSVDSVIPLIVSVFLNYMYLFPVNLEYFHKKTGYISFGTMGCAFINFILNLFFLKMYGYKAAAYTTAASNLILFIVHWIVSRRIEKNKIIDLKILLSAFALVVAFAAIIIMLQGYWYIRYGLLLIGVIIVGIKHKRIISLIKQ